MTEQIQEQISAFVDDELSEEESAFLVRRFERDAAARGQFVRYATIGAALRGELLQPYPGVLRNRITEAMTGAAPATARGQRTALLKAQFSRPVIGFGIAATVAVSSLLVLRSTNELGSPVEASSTDAAQAGQWTEPGSYVVPQDLPEPGRVTVAPPFRLTNYILHHSEYATNLSRTSVHSNVVSAADTPLADAEQPGDEVQAEQDK